MSVRPNLVGCWVFRTGPDGVVEILLLHRSPGRIFAGIWQCVTGGLEAGERVVDGALRELEEETGIGVDGLEALYSLDQVNLFYAEHVDRIEAEAVFAAHVRPDVEPRLSDEHDDHRWVAPEDARELVVWPAYRAAIDQIDWLVAHPDATRYWRVGPWAHDVSFPPASSR
jgi:8-oxo-dGTP pyrophosphatase MutT (NUDIX family)